MIHSTELSFVIKNRFTTTAPINNETVRISGNVFHSHKLLTLVLTAAILVTKMSPPQLKNFQTKMRKSKSSSRAVKQAKYKVLSLIRDHKTTLFGPISGKLSKHERIKEWKEIFAFAASLYVVPDDKNYTYVRDVFWQNCKKYAIAKLENCKKGNLSKLTACDKVSLDIIGRGSETNDFSVDMDCRLDSIANCYTGNPCRLKESDKVSPDLIERIEADAIDENLDSGHDLTASCSVSSTITMTPQNIPDKMRVAIDERPSFAAKKQKLMIEHLQLLNHKAKLEIALMEKQLGYPPSVFTKNLCEGISEQADATNILDSGVPEIWKYEEEDSEENEGIGEENERIKIGELDEEQQYCS